MLRRRALKLVYSLSNRRKNHRLSYLMKIFKDEEHHLALSVASGDEITGDCRRVTMTTRSSARGEIKSVYAASHVYHGIFLPRTIRGTRGNTD